MHREHSSFSNVSVIGMETTEILHQPVPPIRLPETYMMSHQCLLNTQAKTTCISSPFGNALFYSPKVSVNIRKLEGNGRFYDGSL